MNGAAWTLLAQGPGYALLVAWISVVAGLAASRASLRRYGLSPLLALAAAVGVGGTLWLLGRAHGSAPAAGLRLLALVVTGVVLGYARPRPAAASRVERGALLLAQGPAGALRARRRRRLPTDAVTIGGWPLSLADETRHVKLIGTTGSGKTTAISELLGGALARGDRAIIADPHGGYLARFHEPARGDCVLNPFEARAAAWDVFAELSEDFHADEVARALIPNASGAAAEWAGYARTFLAAVLRQLRATPDASLAELYRLLVVAEARELSLLLDGTPAQPFLEAGNERMFGSLRSVTANAVRGLDYLRTQRAAPLAVRRWVREGSGVLFLPYAADQVAALQSLIAAWLRLAIFQTLSLPPAMEPNGRRLWFVVDELDALGMIDGLNDALARLRKFGGRCVLGFQSIAQVSTVYGAGAAQTLVENCGNTLLLRCSAGEDGGTARFAARLVGEREVAYEQVTRVSAGAGRGRASVSRSLQRRMEPALLPAQIEQLADRTGYLKLASQPHWVPVELAL